MSGKELDFNFLRKDSVSAWLIRHKYHKKIRRCLVGECGRMIMISCECGENIVQDYIENDIKKRKGRKDGK